MKAFLFRTCFLTLFVAAPRGAANQIDWSSPPRQVNLASTGALMDGGFQFQLGVFADGFIPTTSNMGDWANKWVSAGTSIYNPASNSQSYGSTATVSGNTSPFTAGAKAYVWGRAQGAAHDEWILFRSSSWNWPTWITGPNPLPQPLDWNAEYADIFILGTVNPSGAPFLMQSVAVLTYQQWKFEVLAGETLDGPRNDPDHDGVSNLLEFLFGTSPTLSSGAPVTPTSLIDISGQKYLQISIPRLRDRLVSVTVEVSSDLISWQSGTSATTEVSNTHDLLVVRDLTPVVPGLSKRFMRVKTVSPP